MTEIFDEVKKALKTKNVAKINKIISVLTKDDEEDDKVRREMPKMEIIKETQSNDYDEDAYANEVQKERSLSSVERQWKEFTKKMIDSTPDPVVSRVSFSKKKEES